MNMGVTNTSVGLAVYCVSLHEEPGDKFQLVFRCFAENPEHAFEQAEDAYPGCELLTSDLDPDAHYVLCANGADLYWNQEKGSFGDIAHATRYTLNEDLDPNAHYVLCTNSAELYWNQENGSFGDIAHATLYTFDEAAKFRLNSSVASRWVPAELAAANLID